MNCGENMIESDPIPAGVNNFIKICLDDKAYRLLITDLFGNIQVKFANHEIGRFITELNCKLLTFQELMSIDKKRETILQSAKTRPASMITAQITTNNTLIVGTTSTGPATSTQSIETSRNLTQPTPTTRRPLELVPIYPPLTPDELAICIRAMKERQKLSEKVTIDDDTNLELFLLQAFTGERTTVNKIINESADRSISVLTESVGRTLERLVQEGKITSSKAKIKNSEHEYNLYDINFVPNKNKDVFSSLLAKLEDVFTVNSLLILAKTHDIQEEAALQMLEQANTDGDVLLDRPGLYRKST